MLCHDGFFYSSSAGSFTTPVARGEIAPLDAEVWARLLEHVPESLRNRPVCPGYPNMRKCDTKECGHGCILRLVLEGLDSEVFPDPNHSYFFPIFFIFFFGEAFHCGSSIRTGPNLQTSALLTRASSR